MSDPKGRDSWQDLHDLDAERSTSDRERAIQWARDMLTQDFVVLDTETTGLEHHDVAVQIAIVDPAGQVLLDSYVKPWKPIPAAATRIHGITDAMVANAPTILELEDRLKVALHGKIALIYNASYDANILRQSFIYTSAAVTGQHYKLPDDHWTQVGIFKSRDVMYFFAAYYGEWNDYYGDYRWQSLSTAAAHFGISTAGAHGALADALMTLRVVQALAGKGEMGEEIDHQTL